jgi:hypothetical protein
VGAPIVTGHLVAGRYRLLAALGDGGMGTVWQAEDELLTRPVAVKEVSPPASVTAGERAILRERTLREARTAARLSHPNVVTIYDVVEDDGQPWIVMELIAARSLRDLLEADGPLSPQQAARVGLQVLAALTAAHSLGILHRDVTPGNVLIDTVGRAVLADFGIARTQDSPTLTTSGMVVGSPSYIAPERASGEPGGPESDLWSLGATLYAMVEGRPPYDRGGALATLMAVVHEDPDPPTRAGPLWPVIRSLLDHVPSRRPDASEAEQMLRQVTEEADGPGTAPMPAAADPAARPDGTGGSLAAAEQTRTFRPGDTGYIEPAGEPAVSPAHDDPEPGPVAVPDLRPPSEPEPGPAQPAGGPAHEAPVAETASQGGRPDQAQPEQTPPGRPVPHPLAGLFQADTPRSRRRAYGPLATAALAAAAVLAGVVYALVTIGHPGTLAGPGRGGSHAATGHTARSQPDAGRSVTGPAVIPAGWHEFRNSTGFSIAVPDGWRVSHQGHYVYLLPPSGAMFLLIDQSDHPQPNPLADWQQQEASRRGSYPGYHRIRLQAVHYAQAEKAADWEFTYYRQGVLTHVLNRNVLANAKHAYALYWSTPASQWKRDWHVFEVFARTFRPAPA